MLILLSHGSRDPAWRGSLQSLTREVAAGLHPERVGLAFMQFDGPTLADVVEEALEDGTRHFRLLPLFMASAGHVDKDIKPLVGELARRHTDARFELLTPVGEDPLFPGHLMEIAKRPPRVG